MLKKNAFTLVELILSLAIMMLLLLGLYSSFSLGLRAFKQLNVRTDREAQKIFRQLKAQLRSAYITQDDSERFNFQGSRGALKFTTAAMVNDSEIQQQTDLVQVTYNSEFNREKSEQRLIFSFQDALMNTDLKNMTKTTADTRNAEYNKTLTSNLKTIKLSYYDGQDWQDSWNSSVQLPQAVRIDLDLEDKKQNFGVTEYTTAVNIACAYPINENTEGTENTGN